MLRNFNLNKKIISFWICVAIIISSYYTFFFTDAANFYHGGTALTFFYSNTLVWLGVVASYQLLKISKNNLSRWVLIIIMTPLILIIISTFYYRLVN